MANKLPISDLAPVTTYSDDGAIDPRASVVKLTEADTSAMTLADPEEGYDGHIMTIHATAAQAYTVTYTGGFGGIGTGKDVATFGGAIGDGMTIRAVDGTWFVLALFGVTLG